MALKKCPECARDISTTAKSCPNCGYTSKKKSGCLPFLGYSVLIVVGLGILGALISPHKVKLKNISEATKPLSKPAVENEKSTIKFVENADGNYKQGESLRVGYTSYLVTKSWWSDKLSNNEFLDQKPDAAFLFVELVVRNDDIKARVVPPFKLVDQIGSEYEASSKSWAVEGALGIIESLNPSVQKQGFVVFDVPRDRKYKLKLSGGYWSSEEEFVLLTP